MYSTYKLQIMDMLHETFEKLNNGDAFFTKKYDVTIENIWSSDFIRITRKSSKMDESYTYSTDIHIDYNNNSNSNRITKLCFDIYVKKIYLFLTEVRVIACRFNNNSEIKRGFGIGKDPHIQTNTFYDVDIAAIMKYISDMEYEIEQENFQKTNFLAVNEYRCKDCQRKIVNNI